MSLTDQINGAIKEAMIAKEKEKLAALRAIKSELLLLATGKSEANEDAEIKVLQKMVKQRKDSATIYEEQGRADLAKDELFQAEIVSQFLPQQLSEEEITAIIQEVIQSTGASSPADMGKVMGMATKKMAGKAEGKLIASITKQLLNS